MFDGLKEKLSGFTKDVEEDADVEDVEEDADVEDVEEDADVEDVEEDADVVAAETDEAEAEAEDSAADADVEASEADADVETAKTDEAEMEAEAESGAVTADTETSVSEAAADEAADTEVEETDERADDSEAATSDRGLAEKAKLIASGKTVIDEADLQTHLDDLELALLSSDVEMGVAQEILAGVERNLVGETRRRLESTGNIVTDALREALYDVISVGQFDFEQHVADADKPMVIIFTGVNGVGKTTSIAKMAQYLENRGFSTVLANGDTYRAGANEQLQEHARNLDKKCIAHEQGSDPAAVIYDAVEYAEANDVDVVLGDTAGRLHTSNDLMAQLEKIDRVIDPDMTLFVDEAVAGQDAVNRAREFDDAAEVDGSILTKADADPQGGAAISIAHVTGKPILFLGTGQGYDHLERFDPAEIVDELLGE